VTAECGHTRVIRGFREASKHFNPCKSCEAGEPWLPLLAGELGTINNADMTVRDPIANALFNNLAEKSS
jgi:hypothetical protein